MDVVTQPIDARVFVYDLYLCEFEPGVKIINTREAVSKRKDGACV